MIRPFDLKRRLVAEALGSAVLASLVVGSGIMAQRLFIGSDGLALLANALATGAGLLALILALGPISGAHFNPAVSLAFLLTGRLRRAHAAAYTLAQTLGMMLGVVATHAMFSLPLMQVSAHARHGVGYLLSEAIGTFSLVVVILCSDRLDARRTPYAVAALVTAGYWFTASTFFTNPAITLARAFTDTFAGIHPADAPAFMAVQLASAFLAAGFVRWMFQRHPEVS